MSILSFGLTDPGLVRENNEDSFLVDNKIPLYILADGMGGHQGGEVASQMATNVIHDFVKENIDKINDPKMLIQKAISQANQSIFDHAKNNERIYGMGTTVVVLLFKDSFVYIGNVGDSRTYLINQGLLYQLTKDHTLVQEKINLGIYGREQGVHDHMKNVLVRTVGYESQVQVDTFHYKVSKNDIFLLCSDGLHGLVSDHDIIYLFNQKIKDPAKMTQQNVEDIVNTLIDRAKKNGGNDNITTILVTARQKS